MSKRPTCNGARDPFPTPEEIVESMFAGEGYDSESDEYDEKLLMKGQYPMRGTDFSTFAKRVPSFEFLLNLLKLFLVISFLVLPLLAFYIYTLLPLHGLWFICYGVFVLILWGILLVLSWINYSRISSLLLSCPICEGKITHSYKRLQSGRSAGYVRCKKCGTQTPTGYVGRPDDDFLF